MTWRQRYERVLRQRGYTHGEAAREFERNFIRVGSKDAEIPDVLPENAAHEAANSREDDLTDERKVLSTTA